VASAGTTRAQLTGNASLHKTSHSRVLGLAELVDQLQSVNEVLWQVEDDLRASDQAGDFGPAFTKLARSVYRYNDRRWSLKRQIDALLGSRFVEEKQYNTHSPDRPAESPQDLS